MLYRLDREQFSSTDRVCKKCGERAWKAHHDDDSYICHGCNARLQEGDTILSSEQKPLVEGEAEDNGYIDDRADEYCPFCENVTSNMPANRMSLCAHCGAELFPCSACERDNGCQWSQEEYGCQRFIHTPAFAEKIRAEYGW